MKRAYFIISSLLLFGFSSCLNNLFSELKQVFPNSDLNKVKEIEFYDYKTKSTQVIRDIERIKWYAEFFKDSTNYYKTEAIDNERGVKAVYGLIFISEVDTLDLSIYPSDSPNKVVAAYFDPYDPNDHWKYRRYNRFYINDEIVDSLKSNWK